MVGVSIWNMVEDNMEREMLNLKVSKESKHMGTGEALHSQYINTTINFKEKGEDDKIYNIV